MKVLEDAVGEEEVEGRIFEVVMGRLGLVERLLYDTRVVSSPRPFQDRTHVF